MNSGVCAGCGDWVAPLLDFDAKTMTCPQCGTVMPQTFLPLSILTGASGTGKTAVVPYLRSLLPDWDIFETDILWDSGGSWETAKCNWLRIAHSIAQSGRRTLLCGTLLPEQVASCDHLPYFPTIHWLALICEESTLRQRLAARPQWRGSTANSIAEQLKLNRWLSAYADTAFSPPLVLFDTTHEPIAGTARRISDWASSR